MLYTDAKELVDVNGGSISVLISMNVIAWTVVIYTTNKKD